MKNRQNRYMSRYAERSLRLAGPGLLLWVIGGVVVLGLLRLLGVDLGLVGW